MIFFSSKWERIRLFSQGEILDVRRLLREVTLELNSLVNMHILSGKSFFNLELWFYK
jgi:hypothetical protein